MNKEQALSALETISKAWLGSLGDSFTFEKAALAQQSIAILKQAITESETKAPKSSK